MLTAVFGLVGVVIGALVSGGVSLFLEQCREANSIATAKRLVLDELHTIWSHLRMLAEHQVTPLELSAEEAFRFLPTNDWSTYREALANPRAFSDYRWIALSNFMGGIEAERLIILREAPLSPIPPAAKIDQALDLAADLYETMSGRSPEDI